MEKNLRRSMALSGGEAGILFSSPIAISLYLLALLSLLLPLIARRVRVRSRQRGRTIAEVD
jgi:putative tricarboxylic transport membrane protein